MLTLFKFLFLMLDWLYLVEIVARDIIVQVGVSDIPFIYPLLQIPGLSVKPVKDVAIEPALKKMKQWDEEPSFEPCNNRLNT